MCKSLNLKYEISRHKYNNHIHYHVQDFQKCASHILFPVSMVVFVSLYVSEHHKVWDRNSYSKVLTHAFLLRALHMVLMVYYIDILMGPPLIDYDIKQISFWDIICPLFCPFFCFIINCLFGLSVKQCVEILESWLFWCMVILVSGIQIITI